MVRKVIKFPAPSLRKPTTRLTFPLAPEVLEHIQDLHETLESDPNGAALSSNQIAADGVRAFVTTGKYLPKEVYNPQWAPVGPSTASEVEGCLSLPGFGITVKRAEKIMVSFLDREGNPMHMTLGGFAARMFQHESDHLDGKLIYDYADLRTQMHVKQQSIKDRKAGK